nr:MAG TPA: hypothetical protein [Caudoviricetes sp.]
MLLSSRESDHHKGGQEELLPILNDSGQGERVRFVDSEIGQLGSVTVTTRGGGLEHVDHFGDCRQSRRGVASASATSVQLVFELLELGLIDLGGIDGDLSGCSHTIDTDFDWIGADLPAQGLSLRRIIDGRICALGRGCGGTIDQVQLVAVVDASGIVADLGTVRETELATSLLTNGNALNRSGLTVTRSELRRISEGLDGGTEFLSGSQSQVLDVVGVLSGRFSAGRRFGDASQTVPSDTGIVTGTILLHDEQNATIDASLILTFAGLIPNKSCHGILLSEINDK